MIAPLHSPSPWIARARVFRWLNPLVFVVCMLAFSAFGIGEARAAAAADENMADLSALTRIVDFDAQLDLDLDLNLEMAEGMEFAFGEALRSCSYGQGMIETLWNGQAIVMETGSVPACGSPLLLDMAFLGALVIAVIVVVRIRHNTERKRIDLARRYIEKGIEPPESLFPSAARVDLRRGIVLIASGLGMLAASLSSSVTSSATSVISHLGAAGLIPGFIGLGYLVSFAVSRWYARGK